MICRRVQELTSFIVMDVLERAQEMERAGESVIHLEVGEPDFDTPEAIKEAAIEALRRGETHYTHSLGTRQLREAICKYYSETYGVRWLEPDQILVTSGTSPAFLIGMGAILECREEVILSDPHYACHPNFIRFLEAIPKMIPVYEEDGFQYRPEAIRAALTPNTKAILINSPANPTGNLLEPERMAEIADMGRWVLSDEIYHGLVYEGRARSILEFTDRCIVFNGFSKLFAMTGWRLGYLIVPKELVRVMQKMLQNFFISANAMVQTAGCVALTDPRSRRMFRRCATPTMSAANLSSRVCGKSVSTSPWNPPEPSTRLPTPADSPRIRTPLPLRFWKMPGSALRPGLTSDRMEKVTCVSATPILWKTSPKGCEE